MSWFTSSFFSAEPDDAGGQSQSVAPSQAVAKPASIPTETRQPRAKAPASKGKMLSKWETHSDDEGDYAMKEELDEDELKAQKGYMSPSTAHMSPVADSVIPMMGHEGGIHEVRPSKPLPSFEESVWKLRDPRLTKQSEFADVDDDDDDDVGMKDLVALEHQQLKLQNELKMREKLLEEEKVIKEQDLARNNMSGVNALSASRVIVGVAKVKLNMMRQKMKLYEEAEYQGTEANLRARKLLTWMAILSFLQKFDSKMIEPDIKQAKRIEYLKRLEPPPPPPPAEEPPNSDDEELHDKYEAMIRRYENDWQAEGQKVLGEDKFREVQKGLMKDRKGMTPAKREKDEIAKACLAKAQHVMNESEYQELLRKAWRLSDDHADLDTYDPAAWAAKLAKDRRESGGK